MEYRSCRDTHSGASLDADTSESGQRGRNFGHNPSALNNRFLGCERKLARRPGVGILEVAGGAGPADFPATGFQVVADARNSGGQESHDRETHYKFLNRSRKKNSGRSFILLFCFLFLFFAFLSLKGHMSGQGHLIFVFFSPPKIETPRSGKQLFSHPIMS